jgi:hypothetical protein
MFKELRSILLPGLPSALDEAERELKLAEREFLEVITKVDYYMAMVECHESRIRRLREVIGTKNVLAGMSGCGEIMPEIKMH